jgi:carbon starvation protein
MFGIANQLLACAALCVGTTVILRHAQKKSYALVTILPLCFVGTTTISAGVLSVFTIYYPMAINAATRITGMVNLIVTSALLVGVAFVIVGSVRRWLAMIRLPSVGVGVGQGGE